MESCSNHWERDTKKSPPARTKNKFTIVMTIDQCIVDLNYYYSIQILGYNIEKRIRRVKPLVKTKKKVDKTIIT